MNKFTKLPTSPPIGYRGSDVAKALNVSRASVSRAMSRGEKLIGKDQRLWDLLKTS